jgi:PAS domain S-box-containing protein
MVQRDGIAGSRLCGGRRYLHPKTTAKETINRVFRWSTRTRGDGSSATVYAALFVLAGVAIELGLLALGFWSEGGALGAGTILVLNVATLAAALILLRSLLAYRRRSMSMRDEEFSEMSRRLDLAMEVSQIGFWDVDLDTDMLSWDARACQLMGVPYKEDYFTEADWLGAVHHDDRDRAGAAAVAAIKTGGQFVSDYRVIWPNGETRHLRDMAAFYYGNNGRPRLAGLVWDVTADKEREAELELRRREAEAADKAKSTFLAAMSHEIRTPLAGVIGMLDLMETEGLAPDQMQRARIAGASAQGLLQLLNDVLDLSKLEAASVTLSPTPVVSRQLVSEVGDLMAARAAQKGLAFTLEVAATVPVWVRLDPIRFRQVLTNLLSNAIAYTDEGFVAVEVDWQTMPATSLRIAVRDSGIGISESDVTRIFERFVQAEGSSKRQSGGTGLGLAIARELVELMGGEIIVDSTPGLGSTFTFTVRAELSEAGSEPATPVHEVHSEDALDILVADDNATNRMLINSLLKREGHRVRLVENGKEAVEAVRRSLYDAILMDIRMPVMDGLTAARQIRSMDRPKCHVPIIALTASVLSDDKARYIEAGMTECLAKPIDFAALKSVLARTVSAEEPPRSRIAS